MSENEYKEFVLEDYDRKVAARLLPAELVSPTPGGLKAESVKVCERRFSNKDEIILQSFFNEKDGATGYKLAIQNSNAEVFKSLSNFLRDRSIATALKNINLLAWLIDFQPRPYHLNLVIKTTAGGQVITPTVNPTIIETPLLKGRKKLYILILVILVLATGLLAYDLAANHISGNEGCMLWENDHYQPKDCNTKQYQRLDATLVANFKRITKPDTLTLYSVGKVWYVKSNGKVEFFTCGGYYPTDTNKRLLRMSDHILKKYVYHLSD